MTTISQTEATLSNKKVVPVPGERNILITSALPYVNNVPHLGNIIGAVLSADVYARYCRQRGYNTLYICGTDEYGTATETKALEEGVSEREICDKYFKIHKEVYEWFDIAFDHFGRTTTEQQTKIAQHIFLKLHENQHLLTDTQEQLFDPVTKRYLADRFVCGICPHCGYEDARGDQCDRCGKLLNPMELINPRSALSKATPEKRISEHLFLNLPQLEQPLRQWLAESQKTGDWTKVATDITASWLQEGLKPRCITRDLRWGTPVPLEKYAEKVFYVWFDAPIGYISITANYTQDWEKWWKDPENVRLVQFMGKDNVSFHSVIFPSSLLGTGENWTKVNSLSSTEYLNYEEGKFSKSRGIGVFGDHAKETGIAPEVWRYYLLTNRPEQADTIFAWKDFALKNNTELLSNLGNYVNRILKFIANNLEGKVPARSAELTTLETTLISKVNEELKNYIQALEKIKLKEGLHIAMSISALGNKYLQDTKPWDLLKTNKDYCCTVSNVATQLTYLLVAILEPYMPGFTKKILNQMNIDLKGQVLRIPETFNLDAVPAGHALGVIEPPFKILDEKLIEGLKNKFSGNQKEKEKFKLDVKVGEILSVQDHPSAENLYVLSINVGMKQEEKKQIVGGIRAHYTKEQLIGKQVLVCCNLKHSKFKGVNSEGMLLAAKTATNFGLLTPEAKVPVGVQIIPEGSSLDCKEIIKPKELPNILKTLQVGASSTAFFKNFPFKAAGQLVKAENGVEEGAPIG